jgi:hypothetical protein
MSHGRTGHCGNVAISARRFFENARLFFKSAWHFEDILREIEAFFNNCEGLRGFLNTFLVEMRLF